MKSGIIALLSVIVVLTVTGCGEGQGTITDNQSQPKRLTRWYSELQVVKGYHLFQANCATCHQTDASGTKEWRKPDASGNYPPPPLNGTAHTWHHPLAILRRTVQTGGIPLGGTMPPFGDKLTAEEIDNILAWVQSHWSDEIYAAWNTSNLQAQR